MEFSARNTKVHHAIKPVLSLEGARDRPCAGAPPMMSHRQVTEGTDWM